MNSSSNKHTSLPDKDNPATQTEETPAESKGKAIFHDYILPCLIALILALFFTQCVIFNARVPSESMVSTIESGDRFVGWRPAYFFGKPEQGDIIVFHSYEFSGGIYDCTLVKRVIATEGQRVRIHEGVVYINDVPLDEPYVDSPYDSEMGEMRVPEGCCFVLGDNRPSSYDSRYWINPFVRYSDIYAKVIWIYYPHPRIPD